MNIFDDTPYHRIDDNLDMYRVDRNHELESSYEAIINNRNVLIFGERGIGKSFLINLLSKKIKKENVFHSIDLDFRMTSYQKNYDDTFFYRTLLKTLCLDIWKKKYKRDIYDIRKGAGHNDKIFQEKLGKKVIETYDLIVQIEKEITFREVNSLGLNLAFKGDSSSDLAEKKKQQSVDKNEIFYLFEELLTLYIDKENVKKVIFICDEINLLPYEEQKLIFLSYLEIFNKTQCQFVLVGSEISLINLAESSNFFGAIFSLTGFSETVIIKELIEKRLKKGTIKIENEVYEILGKSFKGNPRMMIVALSKYIEDNYIRQNKSEGIIDSHLFSLFCIGYILQIKQLEQV